MKKYLTSKIEKKIHSTWAFFCNLMNHLILERKFSQLEMPFKSEVYLACINFWKFHDDITCLEVMRLPSWPENVKFIVKMQFFAFLTPWEICLNQLQIWNLVFLEVFILPQNQYFYFHFWTFKGTLKMLHITFCPQIQQEKSLKWP